jgi:hypothetical protein
MSAKDEQDSKKNVVQTTRGAMSKQDQINAIVNGSIVNVQLVAT